jgi:hypothetical protein
MEATPRFGFRYVSANLPNRMCPNGDNRRPLTPESDSIAARLRALTSICSRYIILNLSGPYC